MGLVKVPRLVAPLLDLGWKKTDVAKWARGRLGEDFIAKTHSCWNQDPCGKCPACLARKNALKNSAIA